MMAYSIKQNLKFLLLFSLGIVFLHCSTQKEMVWDSNALSENPDENGIERIIDQIGAHETIPISPPSLTITYPYSGSLFPRDIAAPVFTWTDTNPKSRHWLVTFRFENPAKPVYAIVNRTSWLPDQQLWERVKANSIAAPVNMTVTGISELDTPAVTSQNRIFFGTSTDPVEASVFFRQVPLPFSTDNFDQMKWCLGDITSNEPPRVVMKNLSICASCHVFSKDGRTLSMEMNFGNDSGAQFVAPVEEEICLSEENFISWNDYPRAGILPKSRGLFGRMSPNANYIASSVNEISLALITNDPQFSQVFFPTYGILAAYSIKKKIFQPLPGADDFSLVHANPNWSLDEKYIVFSRAKTKNEVHEDITHVVPIIKDEGIHTLNEKFNIQFDLYRIAFNDGKGGVAEPLIGASQNGFSNYFPRYSPDGKWIVYTRSKTGIMLQPDSQLYIIPSRGGSARKMNCNRKLFNSWHSWSPNGKWLLFSSKVNSPYTEIFLTHVDEKGNDTPPVLLSQFSSTTHAANVPEFANIRPDAIKRIRVEGY